MPYYIYRIRPFTQLDKLAGFDTFNDASAQAKAMRGAQAAGTPDKIKIIFADSERQAEELLSQVRTPAPRGDD